MIKRKKPKHPERTTKKKLRSISSLKKELDTIYSLYIRQKYAEPNGNCACYTCSKQGHWKTLQNGHYISRRHHSTRWHDQNCRPQCPGCNIFNQGNAPAFALHLVREFGPEILEELEKIKNQTVHLDRLFYESKIEEIKQKLNNL
jgi:hypothetical protein